MYDDRIKRFQKAGLYLVTSESLSSGRTTREIVRKVLDAGVTLIQLREKELPMPDFLKLAKEIRKMTDQYGALLIINDYLEIALEVGADGVHLGQEDMDISEARAAATEFIIGASSHTIEEAVSSEKAGASYVNIGPLFPTGTKKWNKEFLGIEGLKTIAPHVSVPFTVMGGIKKEHIPELTAAGAQTIALVTAVTAQPDPGAAASELLDLIRKPV